MSQPEIKVDDSGGGTTVPPPAINIDETPVSTPTITTSPPILTISNDADPVKLMKEGKFNQPSGLGVPGKPGSNTSRISARFRAVGNLVSTNCY